MYKQKNIVILIAILFYTQLIYATEIIGNLSGSYATIGFISEQFFRAVSFQMSSQAYTLDNVKAVLMKFSGTESLAQTYVELRSHNGTNVPTNTVIATFNPNPLTGTNYGSTYTISTFTPTSTFIIELLYRIKSKS